jgi:c-di-GMP-related signal transduction protein
LNFHVAFLPIFKKNFFYYELLIRDSLEKINVNKATAKIIEKLGFILRLKSLIQGSLVFTNVGNDSLINVYCLTFEQHFQKIITAFNSLPRIKSPSEKFEIHTDFQHPLRIGVMQAEAVSGISEC